MARPIIISAKSNYCPDCLGTVFEVKTELGNIMQCKDCGNTYQITDKESKSRQYHIQNVEDNEIFTLEVI